MTTELRAAERHARLSAVHDEARAVYDELAARIADHQKEADATLAAGDVDSYDQKRGALDALRAELDRQGMRLADIARQRDAVGRERVREEHTARLVAAEQSRVRAEHEVERHLAELTPLVEALRATLAAGRAAEEKVAACRAEIHSLRISLGELDNGSPLRWTHRPIIDLLQRNPNLEDLSKNGIR